MKLGINICVPGMAVDRRVDEDGYRTLLIGRATRVTLVVLIVCVCGIWNRRDCSRTRDRWESLTTWNHVSSWYAVITEPSPVVCRSRMMITFERVWPVGRFGVGRSLFVVPQQRRAGTVPHLLCFRDIPGHTKPQRAKKT